MPIYSLLQHQAFEPEHRDAMCRAFENVLQELGLTDRSDPLCDLVAHKIIQVGQKGERDPERLRDLVLAMIRL